MTPSEFLRAVWPDDGFYCIGIPYTAGSGALEHTMLKDIDKAADFAVEQAKSKNVFFGVHSFAKDRIWNDRHHYDKARKAWVAGWSQRTQSNTLYGKAFFFDLDVGVSENAKKYATQGDAFAAIKDFCKATGLPKPMITSSGGGLHIYWILTRALPSNTEWVSIAQRLRQLAQRHKLLFDPSRTTDTASVLRVTSTFNHKKEGEPRPVRVLTTTVPIEPEAFNDIIVSQLQLAKIDPLPDRSVESILGSNMDKEYDGPLTDFEDVRKACKQMERAWQLKGRVPEPEWFHTLQLVRCCINGRELCHEISAGDPRYSIEGCDAKIDQLDVKKAGPTSCLTIREKFGSADEDLCKGCQFYTQPAGFNPLKAARLTAVAPAPIVIETDLETGQQVEVSIPQPPLPYKRLKAGGGFGIQRERDDGSQYILPIHHNDLYPVDRFADRDAGTENQKWMYHPPHEPPFAFMLEAADFVDTRSLARALANRGIYVESNNYANVRDYMSAYIRQLQKDKAPKQHFEHFGWTKDYTGFVFRDQIMMANNVVRPITLGPTASDYKSMVDQGGTLAGQIAALKFYNKPGYERHQFLIASSLGSTLLHMLDFSGVLVNCTGDAGAGKSTALKAAASLWGPPKRYVRNGTKEGGTALARDRRRSVLSSLPNCIDELTDMDPIAVKSMVMNITQETERDTLDSKRRLRKGSDMTRSNTTLTTSNTVLQSFLQRNNAAGAAGAVRVFEMMFEDRKIHTAPEANAFLREIGVHHGWIGPAFAQYVMNNYALVNDRVQKQYDKLITAYRMKPEERFWFAAISVALVALQIAVRQGWLFYDPVVMLNVVLKDVLWQQRSIVSEERAMNDPLTVLNDFFLAHVGSLAIMIKYGSNVYLHNRPNRELVGEVAHFRGEALISPKQFQEFCRRAGVDHHRAVMNLTDRKIITGKHRSTIASGTEWSQPRAYYYRVDLKHPDLIGMIEEPKPKPLDQMANITQPLTGQP